MNESLYKDKYPVFEQLKQEVLFILEKQLKEEKIKYHSLSARIKALDSLYAKMNRKQVTILDDIDDIVGIRIVCLFISDIKRIRNLIVESFNVLSEDNKIEDYEISSFGYMSVHYIAQLKDDYSGPRYNSIKGMKVEIQVRTVLMDAWANVSHYLDYKNEIAVPKELKKDFYALSGLFYIADSHFEIFYKSSNESRDKLKADFAVKNPDYNKEINIDTLTAYLRIKFPDRELSDTKDISEVVKELYEFDYSIIKQLDFDINRAWEAFINYENCCPPEKKEGNKFNEVGVIRVILKIVNKDYNRVYGISLYNQAIIDSRNLLKN